MFQIGGLIVFCGLLAQLQALSLPQGPNPASPTDLAGNFTNALSNGLVSGGLLDNLSNLPLSKVMKSGKGSSGGLAGLIGKMTSSIPILNSFVDIKITNPELMELGLEQSSDGHRLYVDMPLGFVFNLKMPLLGSLLKMSAKLNITAEVLTVTDDKQKVHLVIGDCTHSPGNLQITLLDGYSRSLQKLLDNFTTILTKSLPEMVQNQVCPLVNALLSEMDVTLMNQIINQLVQGTHFVMKI